MRVKTNISLFFAILFFSIPGYANWAAYKAMSHQEFAAMPFIGTVIENGDHVNISRYSISQTTVVDINTPFNTELKWTWTGPAQTFTTSITFIKFAEEPAPNPDDPPLEYGCWLLENGTCHNGIYTATRYIALGDLTEQDLGNWTLNLSYGGSSIYNVDFVLVTGLFEKTGGDRQTGKVLESLPAPLEIRLTDNNGEPLQSKPVKFQITSQPKVSRKGVGATIEKDAPNSISSTDSITATTDANGVAAAILTLGSKEGIYGVTATSGEAKFQFPVFVSNTNAELGFDLGKELGVPCGAEKCGNPINITVGNKYQQETDIPNIAPSLLEFTRSYNSMGSDSQDMGWGWQHNYSRSIETVTSGNGPKAKTTTYATRFDGKRYTFIEDGGLLTTDADIHDELVADANGWTYTQDNTIEKYDSSGRLVSITYLGGAGAFSPDNPDSRTVTLTYNILDQLESVTDDVGSSLTFTYSAFDRIISVTDQAMRKWEYTYGILGNLEDALNPDGTMRDYLYEDLLNNPNALTGITNELGNRYATWAYDVDGMAISSYHANNVDRIDVEYHEDMSRTVTNNRNGITTYQVMTQNQSTLITSVDGVGCSTCAEVNSSFKYDGQNNKVEQTVNGVKTLYRGYGDTKYPRDIIIGAGTTEENTTSIYYDSRFSGLESHVIGESIYPPKDPGNTVVPYNTLTEKVYDDVGNVLSITENGFAPDGTALAPKVTTFTYDGPLGQVSQIDGPRTDVSDITTFEYYPNEPSFDNIRARLKRVTNALGQVVRDNIQYTATGKVKSETRVNGITISNVYYPGNDRLWIMNESNGTEANNTRWRYYDSGEVWDITTDYGGPNESMVIFGYDDARRLTSIRDGVGNYRTFILDTEGNVKEEKTSDGNVLHQHLVKTFDAYNRLESVSQSNESLTYTYAPDHTVESELDGNNVTTSYDYDGLKRLTSTTENSGVSTLSTTQDFDRQGNLIAVTGATNANLDYDDFGNLRSSKIDNQLATTYTYDQAGNRLTQLDGNTRLIQYQYDALNRLTNVDAPGTADDIVYGYDTCLNGQGLLCSMTMASGTTTYTYDGLGRVKSHQGVVYTYDSAGRTKTISYPSGSVIGYDYDLAGQIQSVNDTGGGAIAYGITHEPFGPVDGFNYGNGLTYSASFDTANRPERQETIGLFNRSYDQYDGNGNLLQLSETKNSVTTLDAFSYDWGDRLETASGLFGTRDYTYESPSDYSYSDRASHDEGSELFDYDYSLHLLDIGTKATSTILYQQYTLDGQLYICLDLSGNCPSKTIWDLTTASSQATEIGYDWVGNGISKTFWDYNNCVYAAYTAEEVIIYGLTDTHYYDCTEAITNWGYEYSAYNQINRVTLADLEQASYEYNALRQRVSKTLPDGSVARYVYGLDGLLLAELDGLDNVIKEYVYLSGKLLAVRDFSSGIEQLYYAHTDHLGMPELLTDAAGHTVWSGDFDPFGKEVTINEDVDGDTINVSLNIRFPGQYYDAETGLYYNWNRYYDPEIGQYTSSDPIGLDGGLNTYTYVGGNPVGWVDPNGLDPFLVGRPLNSALGNLGLRHAFVASDADYIGDPNATIHSYGKMNSGLTGPVDYLTSGFSDGTLGEDIKFWRALAKNSCPISSPNVSDIPASDDSINDTANSFRPRWPYAIGGINSNAAAQAVANTASGTSVPMPSNGIYPGSSFSNSIQFNP